MELSMEKPDAPPKSVWYLIVATVVWEALAFLPALLLHFRFEYAQSHAVPFETQGLLIEITKLSGYAIVFFGNYIQGRVIGQGSVRTGLGDQPTSRRAIVGLLAVLIAARAIQSDYMLYFDYRQLLYQQFVIDESSPWLSLTHAFFSVLLAPLSEELFYRGWLWTGLRKHWGFLPTAVFTSVAWLVGHPVGTVGWLLPVAVILSVARHSGQSVRASIALHILYNFIVIISPRVLNAAGLL
jgi:membrane protease YdiL (CAAX protease family)